MRPLVLKAGGDLLVGRPMDPLHRDHPVPLLHIPIDPGEIGIGITPPEPLSQVVDGPFYLPLDPGRVGRAGEGGVAGVGTEVEKRAVELRSADVSPDHHVFHVVVQDLLGYASQELEGMLMAVEKRRHGAPFDELDIHLSGVPQHQQEDIQGLHLPSG